MPRENLGHIELNVPGRHNIPQRGGCRCRRPAVGATPAQIRSICPSSGALTGWFEVLGQVNGVTITDDYAHHPAELKVTLGGRQRDGFQSGMGGVPAFTYSRTALLWRILPKVLPLQTGWSSRPSWAPRSQHPWDLRQRLGG